MLSEDKAKKETTLSAASPLEEPQDLGVSLKLGKTHYEWLQTWSRRRLGVSNMSGILRLIIQERWEMEHGVRRDDGLRRESE